MLDTSFKPKSTLGIVSYAPIRAEGLLSVFDDHSIIQPVVGDVHTLLEVHHLHHLLIDVSTQDPWLDTLFLVRRVRPDIRQIILGPERDDEAVLRSILAGGRAYIDANTEPELIRSAVESVMHGSIWLPRKVLRMLLDRLLSGTVSNPATDLKRLTERERQVLECILDARSNREIAEDLGIEERTVKAYVTSLMRKTGVRNRVELSMLASSHGSPQVTG